ncbi:MAG: RluA family pseudouridine synthase [Bacteroidales bacterium]|nr:RluA family pseudouridine synthase [Bacteroidales bacterium]
MNKTEYTVRQAQELLPFLLAQMPDSSRSRVKELLAHNVYVDGRRTSQFNFPLQPGMRVSIDRPRGRDRLRPRELDIVFEDQHLLVVNKHEGLLSYSKHPADKTVITVLNQYLEATHQRCHAHVVHRLDRDTSGLMLVSKSKEVSRKLEEDWKGLVFDRRYVAVAWGRLDPPRGEVRSWFTDGEYCVLSSPVDNGGKLAVTHYEVRQTSRRYSLVELKLDTGRRNQIRVHLRDLQHPVVHDPMYGYKDDLSPVSRLCLHAFRLCFTHPVTGRRHRFETPVPSQFLKLMEL